MRMGKNARVDQEPIRGRREKPPEGRSPRATWGIINEARRENQRRTHLERINELRTDIGEGEEGEFGWQH